MDLYYKLQSKRRKYNKYHNIYYWNKVTVHHLKLCYFLMKKDNTMICGVLLNHSLTVNRIIDDDDACVVVVKLASTPMMDTHDTEFVN